MATTLEIVNGISQAMANTHDGALDEKGEPVKAIDNEDLITQWLFPSEPTSVPCCENDKHKYVPPDDKSEPNEDKETLSLSPEAVNGTQLDFTRVHVVSIALK